MVKTNYDILKIQDGASKKDIRQAYRNLVLKLHSDRGGDDAVSYTHLTLPTTPYV